MSSQTVMMPGVLRPAPLYPFLSQPPPPKKRPTAPLPAPPTQKCPNPPRSSNCGRRRSATTSAIAAWAANVHPGSPAPYSPRRSPSGLSISLTRRPSIGSTGLSPASFNVFDTPTTASKITPSIKDFKPDLTAMGYTSIFVNISRTPLSPDNHCVPSPSSPKVLPLSPAKHSQRGLKRFQSLSALRSARRARSRIPSSPPISNSRSSEDTRARSQSNTATIKSKKSKYPKIRPAPLSNELALAQLIDGGSLEDHAKQFARRHAKATGAVKQDGQLVGVGDVWRDEEGQMWMDREEAWEYAHLLGKDSPQSDWVRFEDGEKPLDEARRESLSTQDSDLSPRYAMNTEVESRGDDLAAFTRPSDRELCKPGMSVLAIPARSRRAAKHLRKPEFLLNVFPVPLSPRLGSSASPRIAAFRSSALKAKVRRRPAPLNLAPPPPALKFPTNPSDLERNRKDFLENSFVPPLMPASTIQPQLISLSSPTQVHTSSRRVVSRSSVANMRGVFKALSSKKGAAA